MRLKFRVLLEEIIPKRIAVVIMYTTLITTLLVSCIQIYDRCKFHKQVKEIAIKETRYRCHTLSKDTSFVELDSIKRNTKTISVTNKQISISNNIFNNSADSQLEPKLEISLDILAKSDALLNANGLTFCITLIVSLLASLIAIKFETNEQKMRETIEKNIASRYINKSKFDRLLIRIESAYTSSLFIGNMSMLLSPTNNANNTSILIGYLCSRLALICNDIDSRLSKRENKLDFLTKEEKEILNMYLEDALGELKRSLLRARRIANEDLCNIIDNNIKTLDDIKDQVDAIELEQTK